MGIERGSSFLPPEEPPPEPEKEEFLVPPPEAEQMPLPGTERGEAVPAPEQQERIEPPEPIESRLQQAAPVRPIPSPEEHITYIENHYPRESATAASNILYRGVRLGAKLMRIGKRTEGKDNIPQDEPFLIVAPHEGGETPHLIATFDQPIHVMAGRESNFDRRSAAGRKAMSLMKMLPVSETLGNLSPEEQAEAIRATSSLEEKRAYEAVQERMGQKSMRGAEDVKRAVACLIRGEPVVVYPQGLFTRSQQGRPGSGGYALIAAEYQRQTDKKLPILPVAVDKGNVSVRPPFLLPLYERGQGESKSRYYGRIAMEKIAGK